MAGSPKVGLVLGAGGVMGGAWLTGALEALATETGWDPASADRIVGTSAGSMIGALVAFGREDAPEADLAEAVAASCAIPGFYEPVEIGGRRYVDGGLWSTSNLDILRNQDLDVVICLNPTSSLHPPFAWNPVERIAAALRRTSGRRLGSERKKLVAAGVDVVLIQPTGDDHAAMGPNLMSTRNRNPVIQTAIRTVREQLRRPEARELLATLPPGPDYKIFEPSGPPSMWPDTLPGAPRWRPPVEEVDAEAV